MVYCPGGRPFRSSWPFRTPPPAGTVTGVPAVLVSVLPAESTTFIVSVPVASWAA